MSEVNATFAATEPWVARTIGETGKYINGLAFKPTDWGDEGMPIIRIQNLTNPTKPLNRTTRAVDPAYVVNPGDILVSWSATLDAFIWDREPGLLNQHIFKVVPDTSVVTRKFLFYTLKKAIAEMVKSEHLHGSTMKHINRGPFLAHKIEVPTLEQQIEIATELEKQFSRLDEAVADLQRVKANLKRYKASVLKAAIEGRLVETEATLAHREGRTFETGEQLLQRILESRPSAWKGKYDSPTPPECLDDALTPDGWTWITVSQAMRERIVNGLSIKESATPTSVRALKLSAMSDQGFDFNDFRWLPIELSKIEDIVIRESDFFVSRGNGSLELVGRGSPAQEPKQAVIFPDTMMRIRFSQVVNVGPWFHALWTTRLVRAQIEKRVKTTAGIYKMAQPELASISVPLPPLAEQVRIVAEVDRHLSIIREVEAEVDANIQRAQALRQSTLSLAFSKQGEQ